MLIEPGQMIAGLPATPLRGLMRELMQCSMSADELRHRLEGNDVDPTGVPDRLVDAGFIRVAERGLTATFAIRDGEDPKTTTLYTTTIAGNALAKARIGKPMTRDKADELLAGLIQGRRREPGSRESLLDRVGLGLRFVCRREQRDPSATSTSTSCTATGMEWTNTGGGMTN